MLRRGHPDAKGSASRAPRGQVPGERADNDDDGARARLTATRADGKGDAHLDLEATLLDDGQISSLNVVPVDQASKKWLDLVIEGKEPGTDDGPKWETFDGPWRGAE